MFRGRKGAGVSRPFVCMHRKHVAVRTQACAYEADIAFLLCYIGGNLQEQHTRFDIEVILFWSLGARIDTKTVSRQHIFLRKWACHVMKIGLRYFPAPYSHVRPFACQRADLNTIWPNWKHSNLTQKAESLSKDNWICVLFELVDNKRRFLYLSCIFWQDVSVNS